LPKELSHPIKVSKLLNKAMADGWVVKEKCGRGKIALDVHPKDLEYTSTKKEPCLRFSHPRYYAKRRYDTKLRRIESRTLKALANHVISSSASTVEADIMVALQADMMKPLWDLLTGSFVKMLGPEENAGIA